jgi:hypothetical protein
MTDWKEAARAQQTRWKGTTSTLSDTARADGTYFEKKEGRSGQVTWQESEKAYAHCLPRAHASDNLLAGVRTEALSRMQRYGIVWHGETPRAGLNGDAGPTTNLLSSQIQCINSLLSLENQPDLLLDRVQSVVPGARKLVPIRHTNQAKPEGLVAFEWIGRKNYLGEKVSGQRTRGARVTSADGLIIAEREAGRRTGVLIEWKFTESYPSAMGSFIGSSGADRRETYRARYEAATSPFTGEKPPIDAFFHEPNYQFLRQTLLAQAMVEAKEHGVDSMVVLALMPAGNRPLMRGVAEGLRTYGETLDVAWSTLVSGPKVRFVWQDTKTWLTATPELTERYGGLFN